MKLLAPALFSLAVFGLPGFAAVAGNLNGQSYSVKLTYNFTTSEDRKGLNLQLPKVEVASLPIPQDGNGKLIQISKEAIKTTKDKRKRRHNLLYLIIVPGVLILASTCMLCRAKFLARKKGISLPSLRQIFARKEPSSPTTKPVPTPKPAPSYYSRAAGNMEFWFFKKFGKEEKNNCNRAPLSYKIGSSSAWNDRVTDTSYRCANAQCPFCKRAGDGYPS